MSHCFSVYRRAVILQAESRKDCEEVRRLCLIQSHSERNYSYNNVQISGIRKIVLKESTTFIQQRMH